MHRRRPQMRSAADFALSQAEFERLRELVREHTGIALSEAKRQLVYGRLARRLRALKLASLRRIHRDARSAAIPSEIEEFINAVTTNLTSFFREPHHFEYLAARIPAVPGGEAPAPRAGCASGAARRPPARSRIPSPWCCAKPSTLLSGWDVKLLATDLDSAVLAPWCGRRLHPERFEGMDPQAHRALLRQGHWRPVRQAARPRRAAQPDHLPAAQSHARAGRCAARSTRSSAAT